MRRFDGRSGQKTNNRGSRRRARFAQDRVMGSGSIKPPAGVVTYGGPLRVPRHLSGLDSSTFELVLAATFTGATPVNNVFSSDPSGDQDWADFQGIYTEYRVLAMTLQYIPNVVGTGTPAGATAPIYVVGDHQSNAALTSYAVAASYADMSPKSLLLPWQKSIRMSGTQEAQYLGVAVAPTIGLYYIKIFGTGIAAAGFGQTILRHLVQFRGRA